MTGNGESVVERDDEGVPLCPWCGEPLYTIDYEVHGRRRWAAESGGYVDVDRFRRSKWTCNHCDGVLDAGFLKAIRLLK